METAIVCFRFSFRFFSSDKKQQHVYKQNPLNKLENILHEKYHLKITDTRHLKLKSID